MSYECECIIFRTNIILPLLTSAILLLLISFSSMCGICMGFLTHRKKNTKTEPKHKNTNNYHGMSTQFFFCLHMLQAIDVSAFVFIRLALVWRCCFFSFVLHTMRLCVPSKYFLFVCLYIFFLS